MDFFELFGQLAIFTRLTLVVDALPLILAAAYAIRPSEARLALMRPLSLATIFAVIAGTLVGSVSVLTGLAASAEPLQNRGPVYAGVAETLVTAVFGMTCLTLAWLLVGVGMWRGMREG